MTARPLAALIDAHGPALVLFARQWCLAPDDAVQDAVLKLAGLRTWPDDPVAWLFRAVRNAAIDRGKADARRRRREQAAAKPVGWFRESDIDGLDAAAAVAALDALPADQREAIVGRLWGGMTLDQAAAVAGCSVSTAHRRYEAGLAALRHTLGAT
jgi:RNA polymerase sigma factor (sigma-70 family)